MGGGFGLTHGTPYQEVLKYISHFSTPIPMPGIIIITAHINVTVYPKHFLGPLFPTLLHNEHLPFKLILLVSQLTKKQVEIAVHNSNKEIHQPTFNSVSSSLC